MLLSWAAMSTRKRGGGRIERAAVALAAALLAGCAGELVVETDTDDLEVTSAACSDEIDNDADGLTDCDDDGCAHLTFCADGGTDGGLDGGADGGEDGWTDGG